MTARDDFFARVNGRVNLDLLAQACVVVIGVGSVGSFVAEHLGRFCGVGHLCLVDGDHLEPHNLTRHACGPAFIAANKADAMSEVLSRVPGLDVGAVNRHIDESFSDRELDELLSVADLIVIATDHLQTQRRVARRALALDIPAVIPSLYADRGGEVFIQLSPNEPCFSCWDQFRPDTADVRGVIAAAADALDVIRQTIYLCLAVLDPESDEARELAPDAADRRPRQLFVLQPSRRMVRLAVERRADCQSCNVGPSSVDPEALGGLMGNRRIARHAESSRQRVARDWAFRQRQPDTLPLIDRLAVSAPVVVEGATVTLRWSTTNAAYVEIDGAGPFPTSGTASFTVTDPKFFQLEAHNPFGRVQAFSPPVRVVRQPRLVPTELPRLQVGGLPLVPLAQRPSPESQPPQTPPQDRVELPGFTWPQITPPSFGFSITERHP